jgi:beta-glucosidase
MGPNETVEVSFNLHNKGTRAGEEIVQLYIHDKIASVAQPLKSLKGFSRVRLAPGESRRITLPLGPKQLAIWDHRMKRVVEPGEFDIMVGASSEDIRLRATMTFSLISPAA